MRKGALILLIFTGLYHVVLCGLYGENIYISEKMHWSEAREYCRLHHIELSLNVTKEELQKEIDDDDENVDFIWLGFRKTDNTTSPPRQRPFLSSIFSQQKDQDSNDSCVTQSMKGLDAMNCMERFTFFCFKRNLVLVKENKTWEEAMEHCRGLDRELISLPSESALAEVLQASGTTQTARIWTGLRYLADSWLWLDGTSAEYQSWSQGELPQCPDWRRLCGALSLEGQQLDSWDCADTLNFICY